MAKFSFLLAAFCCAASLAQAPRERVREIYVPFEELNVILEGQPQRVFMTRREFLELMTKARKTPAEKYPQEATVLSADYEGTVETGRARIKATLGIDVLAEGLHALPLDISGVGVLSAQLDGKSAPLAMGEAGKVTLFVDGQGKRKLDLTVVVPLETSAALQSLNFQLPTPAATQFKLVVPGNVEVRSGADVVSRTVDKQGNQTQLELLLKPGTTSLVMTLNNRLLLKQQVVVARSVQVSEVTSAYERLHASVSLSVLHGAVEQFRFVAPEGFEVTDVSSPLLAQWVVKPEEGRNVLTARLTEPTNETVVLNISAVRTPAVLENWSWPKLEALDVAGQSAVLGLLLEDKLQAHSISTEGLIRIDNRVLTDALPASVLTAEPGAPRIRPVVAYYAPQGAFALSSGFERPDVKLNVTTNVVLTLNEQAQQVRGSFALLPEREKLFALDFSAPQNWKITSVTDSAGSALPFELYPAADNRIRVHVKLPGVAAGQTYNVFFQATYTPAAWLDDWTTKQVPFPLFRVEGAAKDIGAIAVQTADGLRVRPETLEALTPLDERDKARFALANVPTELAYRYEASGYTAALTVERTAPHITARVYNFLRIDHERIAAHYELVYDVTEAHARRLRLTLPASTPASLWIHGLDDVQVSEFNSELVGEERRWTVSLTQRRQGRVRLAVDFEDRFSIVDRVGRGLPQEFPLPLVKADGIAYQSGLVAVEGSAELDVSIVQSPRKIDVGELVDAQYQPGRRLLGAFGYLGDPAVVAVKVARHPGYALPPTIVKRSELVTLVSVHGLTQTAARYELRTKAQFLELELPAGSQLWSTFLDGKPGQPQRDGNRILLSLPPANEDTLRDLQLVYETTAAQIALWRTVEAAAPTLYLRATEGLEANKVPVADLIWHLYVPEGYRLTRTGGTVHTNELVRRPPPLARVGEKLYMLAGGIGEIPFGPMGMPGAASQKHSIESAITSANSVATKADVFADVAEMTPSPAAGEGGEQRDMSTYFAPSRRTPAELMTPAARPGEPPMPPPMAEAKPAEAPPPVTAPAPVTGLEVSPGVGPFAFQNPEARFGQALDGLSNTAFVGEKAVHKASGVWALEGVRSLKIDIQQSGQAVTFKSLGENPKLEATLANRSRLTALAWGVSLLIGLYGLRITRRPTRDKFRFVAAVLVISALVPLAGDWFEELAETFDLAFMTGCLLIPYYMAAAALRWTFGRVSSVAKLEPVAVTTAVLVALVFVVPASAGEPPKGGTTNEILADLEKLITPGRPVDVPKDAIVVPYEGEPNTAPDPAAKLLVPYEQYVELWNRAYPDQKIITRPLPATHALAGAKYRGTLADGEYLLISGQLLIEVYTDEMVAVPLALEGGVLARALVDGQPARLRVPEIDPAEQPVAGKKIAAQPGQTLYVLHVQGKGRKRLDLEVRLKLERQGGWRVAVGRLPVAPASSLELIVPLAQTEVRLANVLDRRAYETTKANETIESALAAGGQVNIQWRPKVGEGQVDQSLTAESTAVLDVREDGLRLHWQMKLDFRRGQREVFTLRLPKDYLVERVTGTNVRGWEVKALEQAATEQELHITLLKAARDREEFGLVLSKRMVIGQGDAPQKIETPMVRAADAVLHHGKLLIRRSPQLELRVGEIEGLSRTDSPMDANTLPVSSIADESPLGIRPLATYQFISTPYKLTLEAESLPMANRAEVQTLVKLTEREATLESRILYHVQGRPMYRARMLLPSGLKLSEVGAPGAYEYAVTDQNGRQLLTVYLAAGQTGQTTIVVRGQQEKPAMGQTWALPNLQLLDVERQEGQIVVQADPAFDVRTSDLVGVEPVLFDRTHAWLQDQQRSLARVALAYRTPDHSGQLTLAARQPRVRSFSVTNVRVTDRAIEETILLEFTIREAGIRQLSFLLPEALKDARISAPLLRQKTVEAVEGGQVRVKLELQDEVIGQLRVLIEHDRLLTSEPHDAPIPMVETGETDARYVTLESAGRDEVVVDEPKGLDVLSRQLSQWKTLASLLGSDITQAYLVRDGAAQPKLTLKTKDRTAVQTVGARIGLAETKLLVDAQGAYRGMVEYHVDNSTEQFLDVELPKGAQLWTVRVAGEGVKPTQVAAKPQAVRIPLIKTAAGDQDYLVVLKYGGQLDSIITGKEVDFPLVKTENIHVELSQVRLFLPDTHHWFDFGGSMTRVKDKADLDAGFLSYRNKQIERLSQMLSSKDAYSRARASNNLKQIGQGIQNFNSIREDLYGNEEVQKQQRANIHALNAAQTVIQQQEADEEKVSADNRLRLYDLYQGQANGRAKNVVQELGGNFVNPNDAPPAKAPESGKDGGKESFNKQWFEQNKLQREAEQTVSKPKGEGQTKDADKKEFDEGRKKLLDGEAANPSNLNGQPQAAGVMQAPGRGEQKEKEEEGFNAQQGERRRSLEFNRQDDSREQVKRYQQRLEEQGQQGQQQMQLPGQQPMQQGVYGINAPPGQPTASDQPAGPGMGMAGSLKDAMQDRSGGGQHAAVQDSDDLTLFGKSQSGQAGGNAPVALASLDVELPSTDGYREVFFKTPRGEVQITARPLSTKISERLVRVGWVGAALVMAGLVYLAVRRYGATILASRSSAVLMLAVGVLSLVTCFLPFAGLLLALTGLTLLVGSLFTRRLTPAYR